MGRGAEVVETLGRRYDIVALQEVKYKNEAARRMRVGELNTDCTGRARILAMVVLVGW